MQIETKYNIGDHIIVIYSANNEVHLYDDYIKEIVLTKAQECTPLGNTMTTKVLYYGNVCPEEIEEDSIILFGDDKAILETIKNNLKDFR